MPQFNGSITDSQANAIVNSLFKWVMQYSSVELARSTIAAIICDAVHEDITLQPLHDAYGRKVGTRI